MTAPSRARSLASLVASHRAFAPLGRDLARGIALLHALWTRRPTAGLSPAESAAVDELMRRAGEAARGERRDEAAALYRQVLKRQRAHLGALRALRDLAIATADWREALDVQQRLIAAAPWAERDAESQWLAIIHYERGRAELAAGRVPVALVELRHAIRADSRFVPAALALGDAHEAAGEVREAVRVWERAAETDPSVPVLGRLERVYRSEGRPSRMIALYRNAAEHAPDDLAVAIALGRVYFELEMLDEAADQFEKIEVRAPNLPVVHAFLGAVFERRGDTAEAFDEYRRALRLSQSFTWPHRCRSCQTVVSSWEDRCPSCRRWNALAPIEGR